MKKNVPLYTALLAVLFAFSPAPLRAESPSTSDPNAALRKITSTGKDPALAEFERVQHLNNDAAIMHFNSVILKDPNNLEARLKRGKAYSGNKNYEKALADYDVVIKLDPKNKDAYVGRAVAHLIRKEYDKCWEDVHQAEALGGQFWPSFMDSLKTTSGRDK